LPCSSQTEFGGRKWSIGETRLFWICSGPYNGRGAFPWHGFPSLHLEVRKPMAKAFPVWHLCNVKSGRDCPVSAPFLCLSHGQGTPPVELDSDLGRNCRPWNGSIPYPPMACSRRDRGDCHDCGDILAHGSATTFRRLEGRNPGSAPPRPAPAARPGVCDQGVIIPVPWDAGVIADCDTCVGRC
jgi:hypothetical protein